MQRLWRYDIRLCGMACLVLSLFWEPVFARKPDKDPEKHYTVLFIGNSLTYTNDLPELVEKAAKKQGIRIEADMLAHADFGLEDHWNSGELPGVISSRQYDYVVVQQGPSSQADGKASLLYYGEKIKTLCDSNGSTMALFMVWPSLFNFKTFEGVIHHYTEAASALGVKLCPVGQVWKDQVDRENDFSYYGPDFFHPSLQGSQAAAEVIVKSLFGE